MRTLKNILKHELIGLNCKVISATNKCQTGLEGKIIDETQKTILLEVENVCKRIPKQGSVFRLKLKDHCIEIKGDEIVTRPENRIKKKFKKW